MPEMVLRKLGSGLGPASQLRFRELLGQHRMLAPRDEVLRPGDMPKSAHFVLDGILARYKALPRGRRAVVAYLLPGDFCGPLPEHRQPMDHSVSAVTAATVAEAPYALMQESLSRDGALAERMMKAVLAESAIQRQWLANMGCPSDKRAAHLLCEMRYRLAQVGKADERSFLLPLTQHELSEALGISTVHVNRVLQHLKDLALVRILDRRVVIADLGALESFAEFDPAYLGGDRAAPVEPRLSAAG